MYTNVCNQTEMTDKATTEISDNSMQMNYIWDYNRENLNHETFLVFLA